MLTLAGFLSAGVSLFLGFYVLRRRRRSRSARYFALLMGANALYAGAYTVELAAPTLEWAVFWLKVEYIGVVLVPVFWFLFSDSYARGGRRVSLRFLPALLLVPAATLVLMWTNELHGWVYAELWLREGVPYSILVSRRGPAFIVITLYLYALLLAGTLRILRNVVLTRGLFRVQGITICLGALLPWLGHALMIFRLSPYNLDLAPFALTISGTVVAVGIFKHRLFDLAPIAWDRVIDAIRDGVIVVDVQDRFVDANAAALRLFPELARLHPGDTAVRFFSELSYRPLVEAGPQETPADSGPDSRFFRFDATAILDTYGHLIGKAVIAADITETRRLMSRLERLATTDELTGTVNRRHFMDMAKRELDRAKRSGDPLSVALFDLDHFKLINDQYGHGAGDAALVAVCDACRTVLRSSDLFCRYGGEEFVILFPETDPRSAMEIAERLRRRIEGVVLASGNAQLKVTASFGVAGSDGTLFSSLAEFLKAADGAMYEAKEQGRNAVCLSIPKPGREEAQGALPF